jgi:SAM-dependent methyltransferase
MASATPPCEKHPAREIEYLSRPSQVSMSDWYFELASIEHFWVRRRFQVLQELAGDLIANAKDMAEFGCGHGLLQRQIEDAYGRQVAGFDLNENALKQNVSRLSKVVCYDVLQRKENLRERFDVVLLFDVLEHIQDEDTFLAAIQFHLAQRGFLIVNTPAGEWAYSGYDVAAGHARRYSIKTLREAAKRNGFEVTKWSYWGLPLAPALAIRKLWFKGKNDQSKVYAAGFDSGDGAINKALGALARCEVIPQKFFGTSVMAVCQHSLSG